MHYMYASGAGGFYASYVNFFKFSFMGNIYVYKWCLVLLLFLFFEHYYYTVV